MSKFFWNDRKETIDRSPVGRGTVRRQKGRKPHFSFYTFLYYLKVFDMHTLLLFLQNSQEIFALFNTNDKISNVPVEGKKAGTEVLTKLTGSRVREHCKLEKKSSERKILILMMI